MDKIVNSLVTQLLRESIFLVFLNANQILKSFLCLNTNLKWWNF